MLSDVILTERKKGGLFGKVLGLASTGIGAVAGGIAGGPGGALKGASIGGSIGGTVGNAVDPVGQTSGRGVALSHVAQNDPGVQFQTIKEAQKNLLDSSDFDDDEKEKLNSIFEQSKPILQQRMKRV